MDGSQKYGLRRTRGPGRKSVSERFWEKVEETASCWNWRASLDPKGYGQFRMRGLVMRAHRYAYESEVAAVPSGMVVCHRCDNPRCVRPSHLFVGTQRDNIRDMIAKGRSRFGGMRREASNV